MIDLSWLDGSLYPDTDIPESLNALPDRVDFLVRLCAACDFGLLPRDVTIAEIRKTEWKPVVNACRLLTSPAYHLLRRWHDLPSMPYLGQQIAAIRDDPCLASNSQYGLIHPQISLITHTCPGGRCQGKKH
jgi:hypothetical protein